MSLTEAARYLRVHPFDLQNAAAAGRVPHHRWDGEVIFVRQELLDDLARPHPCFED